MRIVQRRSAVLAAAVVSVCGSTAFSQTSGTWNVQSGSWGVPANWVGGVIADGAGATADFSKVDLTAAAILTLDSSRTVGTATFGDANISTAAASFGWAVNSAASTTNSLTLLGAGNTAGTLNIGYIVNEPTKGLGNASVTVPTAVTLVGVTIAAPVNAPSGLNINIGEFGTGVIGRRGALALNSTASQISGTLRLNGIGEVTYAGGTAGLAGVTNLEMTNPFTSPGGTQGAANRQLELRLGGGNYNFSSTITGGGTANVDARAGFSSYGTVATNITGNVTLLGGTGAVLEAEGTSSLTVNGNFDGTNQTVQNGSGLTLRGTGPVTINGNISLNRANRASVVKTDSNIVTVNGTIDAYSLAPVSSGTFRLRSFDDVSAETRIFGGAPSLESTGTLTRSLGSGPGQIASAGPMNLGATASGLTINFGGAAAPVLFGDTVTTPANTAANGTTIDLIEFDAGAAGLIPGMFAVGGTIPGNTFITSVNSTLVTLDQAATGSTTTPVSVAFSRPDRINGALNLNSASAAGDVTVLNSLDLNAPSTGTLAAPTVRVVNANKGTVTLQGAVTNSGPGVGTFAKGGAGHLVIAAPININGNFRFLGGTFAVNPGVAVNVNAFEISGGAIDSTTINAITASGGTFVNGGTVNLPTDSSSFAYTFGGPISGVTTSNVSFSNPDGSRGANSGFNNVGTSPATITFNGGAVLERGVTPGFNVTGFRTAPNHSANLTITNDINLNGEFELSNESLTADLIMSGNLGGSTGAIRKRGLGVVRLTGNNTYSNQTLLHEGTLAIASPQALGNADGANGIDVAFLGNSTLRFDAPMTVGNTATGAGIIFATAGTTGVVGTFNTNGNDVTLTGSGNLASQALGQRTAKDGAGKLTIGFVPATPGTEVVSNIAQLLVRNGTLAVAAGNRLVADGNLDRTLHLVVGDGAGSVGVLQVDGGTVTTNGDLKIGGGGASNGTVIVNSGALTMGSLEILMGNGSAAGSQSTLTLNGGTTTAVFVRNSDGATNGTINLNGGSLFTTRINKTPVTGLTNTATFNANGGTLSPRLDVTRAEVLPTFMQGLDAARILEGGLKIDTLGRSTQIKSGTSTSYTMTINQNFTHGGTAAVDGGITKLGTGNVILGGLNSYTGPTSVQVGTLTANAPRSFGAGQLQVASGAIADTKPSLVSPLVIGDINIASGGTVKLNNNKLVIDYTGAAPVDNVRNAILPFYGNGSFDGTTGLMVSPVPAAGQGLGFADTSLMGGVIPAAFATSADATSIIVQVTLLGDATLDGTVGFADLVSLAQNYNGVSKGWFHGDFNYDGTVDFADLVSLAQNYNQSISGGTPVAVGAASAFEADWARAQQIAVPEPAALASLTLLCGVFARRRSATR